MKFPWTNWQRGFNGSSSRKSSASKKTSLGNSVAARRRLFLEPLETRDLLATVSVSASPAGIMEGASAMLTFTRTGPTDTPLNVQYKAEGTATIGSDYTLSPSTSNGNGSYVVTIPTGMTSAMVNVMNTYDIWYYEMPESVIVTVLSDPAYTADSNPATVTIYDSSGMPGGGGGGTQVSVTAQDSSAAEQNSDPGVFRISRTSTGQNVTVTYSLTGSATSGTDYSASSYSSITIPTYSLYADVTITPVDDSLYDPSETVVLTVVSVDGVSVMSPAPSATITITDNDSQTPPANLPVITVSDWEGSENAGSATFTVHLSALSSSDVTLRYSTSNGSASSGYLGMGDYSGASNILLTIPANTNDKVFTIPIFEDSSDELNEDFFVTLSNPSGAQFGSNQTQIQARAQINDNDGPTISIGDGTVTEGGSITFTVSLSTSSVQTVTVNYATDKLTAIAPGDFTSASGTLTFLPGYPTTQTFTVSTSNDVLDEDDEVFNVQLSNATNATIGDGLGFGTILDNDATPTLSIANTSVDESLDYATVSVSLSAVSGRDVSFSYATSGQSATTAVDYTAQSGTVTILAGQSTATILVPIIHDTLDENDETFLVTISNPSNATLASAQAVVTIIDNDAAPTLTIEDASIIEVSGNLAFTVKLSEKSGKAVSVQYQTSQGSATNGQDYSNSSGTLTIPAGTESGTIFIPIIGDSADEVDETFFVALSNATNATIADGSAVGTIQDNDGPAISIGDISVAENIVGGKAIFTISIDTPSPQAIRVNWATSDDSAVAGEDYTAASGTAEIAANTSSVTIEVPLLNDNRDEFDQTFKILLSNPINASIADGVGVATIVDEDAPPVISIEDGTLQESDAGMTFKVKLSQKSEKPVSVLFGTSTISASGELDFYNTTGKVEFAAGEDSKYITITIKDDSLDEVSETFNVRLNTPENATLISPLTEAVGTIIDNDGPTVSITGKTINEAAGTVSLEVKLSSTSPEEVRVAYASASNTGVAGSATPGVDYTSVSGELVFTPGNDTLTISVPILDDTLDEVLESFTVNLFNVVAGNLSESGASAQVAIKDNDGPTISISNVVADESIGTMTFTVTLSATSPEEVRVKYVTQEDSASESEDFTSVGDTLVFQAGTTSLSQTFTVPIINDSADEADEEFKVRLFDPVDAFLAGGASELFAIGKILDNDGPVVSIANSSVSEANGYATFTLELTAASPQDIIVNYETEDGAAKSSKDYTGITSSITIPHGQGSVTIQIPINNDLLDENDEDFKVKLTSATNATISTSSGIGTGTIIDNDEAPTISIEDLSIAENGGTAQVKVRLSGPSGKVVSVSFATNSSPGNATPSLDYSNTSGLLSFDADTGETEKTIAIPIINDSLAENDETFTVDLSNPLNASLTSDTQGQVTILDNEIRIKVEAIDATAGEVNQGSNPGRYRISKTGNGDNSTPGSFMVTFNLSGSATNNTDYTLSPFSYVTLQRIGDNSVDIDLNVINDSMREGSEDATLTLATNSEYSIAPNAGSATVQIVDNDNWTVSIAATKPDAYELGSLKGTFAITRSGESDMSQPLTVYYQIASGSTAQYSDYSFSGGSIGTIQIPANQSTVTLDVVPSQDSYTEAPETVIVKIIPGGSTSGYAVSSQDQATVTIYDASAGTPAPSPGVGNLPELSVTGGSATEGGAITFTFSLSKPAEQEVVVAVATGNRTATAPLDYSAVLSSEVTIPAGSSSATFSVSTIDDSLVEETETMILQLNTAFGATLKQSSAEGTIIDNDDPNSDSSKPKVSITSEVRAKEGDSLTFTIKLDKAATSTVMVHYATSDGAANAGADYESASQTIEIPAGQTEKTISVLAKVDSEAESDENFFVNLTNPVGAVLDTSKSQATGIIQDYASATSTNYDTKYCNCDCGCNGNKAAPSPQDGVSRVRFQGSEEGNWQTLLFDPTNVRMVSNTNPHPIIPADFSFTNDPNRSRDLIEVQLNLGGVVHPSIFYSSAGLVEGKSYRFALLADVDLPSGQYPWTITVREHFATGPDVIQSHSGVQNIQNRIESVAGNRWALDDLWKLSIQEGGVSVVQGDGNSFYFPSLGNGQFGQAAGSSYNPGTLTFANNQYVWRSHTGDTTTFNSDGLMIARANTSGSGLSFTYIDGNNDGLGDELYQVIDNASRVQATYTYTNGKITSIATASGNVTTLAYDTEGRLVSLIETDPDGAGSVQNNAFTYAYDPVTGLLTSTTNASGAIQRFVYYYDRTLAAIRNADGSQTRYESIMHAGTVDTGAGIGTPQTPASLFPTSAVMGRTYDEMGNMTEYLTDQFGGLIYQRDANGNETFWQRNANGQVTKQFDPDPDGPGPLSNPITTTVYDSAGNVQQVTYPDGSTESWTYDPIFNRVTTHTDPLGRQTHYTIDSASGNVLAERKIVGQVDGEGNNEADDVVTSFSYTPAPITATDAPYGLLATVTDPLGNITQYTYDAHGNNTRITFAVGTPREAFTTQEFDSLDRLVASTDELGRRTTYAYDARNHLTETTLPDPDGTGPLAAPVLRKEYSIGGRLNKEIDALGRATVYHYNSRGKLASVDTPDHDNNGQLTTTTYSYDFAGNLVSTTDSLGHKTVFGYDRLGRQVSRVDSDPDGSGPQASPVTQMRYDALGRMTLQVDALGGKTSYAYQNFGRTTVVTLPDPDGNLGTQQAPVYTTVLDAAGQQVQVTGALGEVTSFTYDALGRLQSETTPDPDGNGPLAAATTTYLYDKAGNLLRETDALGNKTEYAYDERNRLIQATQADPDGAGPLSAPVSYFTYDVASQLIASTDPLGRVTSRSYDGLGRLVATTYPDPDGNGPLAAPVQVLQYDIVDRITKAIDALGNATEYVYDLANNVIQIRQADPDGAGPQSQPVTNRTFDSEGKLLSQTDPLGHTTTWQYDSLHRTVSVTQADPDGAGPLSAPVTSFSYDALGNLLSQTDPRGFTTTFEYDLLSRRTKVTLPDPDGPSGPQTSATASVVYDVANRVTSSKDALERITYFSYDRLGRRISTTYPDAILGDSIPAPVQTTTYDVVGNVTAQTDPAGNSTFYTYDNLYRPIKTILPDPDGIGPLSAPEGLRSYDAVGNVISQTDALGNVTATIYDQLDRPVQSISPDPDGSGPQAASIASYVYDAVGNLLSAIDSLSHVVSYAYDNLYRQTSKTDANGGVTKLTYDLAGNTLSLEDSVHNITSWTYDALNRAVTDTNQLGYSRQFAYDASGNLIQKTDRNGRVSQYEVDGWGRTTAEKWLNGQGQPVHTITYAFDAGNQLTSVSDPAATYSYTYDRLGQVSTETQSLTGLAPSIVVSRNYDVSGNLTQAAATLGGSADYVNNYSYDGLQRVTQITQQGALGGNSVTAKRVDLSYDANSNLTGIHRFEGLNTTPAVAQTTQVYDAMGRLASIQHKDGATVLAGYAITWDSASRITQIDSAADGIIHYTNDSTGQLTSEDPTGTTNDRTYGYDANGTRNTSGYTIGSNNQITSDGTYSYSYDQEGNRNRKTKISDGSYTEYSWDYRNRLVAVTENDVNGTVLKQTSLDYDAYNRWIHRSHDADGMGSAEAVDTFYSFLGDQVSLAIESGGEVQNRYLWGPGTDQLLADEQIANNSSNVLWALGNQIGTVADLIDYNATTDEVHVANHRQYDAFGNLISETNASVDEFFTGLAGKAFDESLGLQNNLNRWFDPNLGQWLSEDPIGFLAGDENVRRYIGNGSLDGVDPLGLREPKVPWKFGGYKHEDFLRSDGTFRDGWAFPMAISVIAGDGLTFSQREIQATRARQDRELMEWRTGADEAKLPSDGTCSTLSKAAAIGLRKTWVVGGNAFLMGADPALNEASQLIQRDALERGDKLTQVGYGASKFTGKAAQVAVVGSVAGPLAGGAAAEVPAIQAVLASPVTTYAGGALGAYGAYQSTNNAVNAARDGNFIEATDSALTGTFTLLGTQQLLNRPSATMQNSTTCTMGSRPSAQVSAATEQAAIRARVLANIEASKASRMSSNFDIHIARTSQAGAPYGGIDDWGRTVLPKGSIVYGGYPGQSAFYTDLATVKASKLNAESLFQSLQVSPHPVRGYRPQVQAYRVLDEINVPSASVLANPQFGPGGGAQFYIQSFSNCLEPIRTFNLSR